MKENSTAALRAELEWLRSRYDGGAVSSSIYAVIRTIETELSWREQQGRQFRGTYQQGGPKDRRL